MCVCGLILRLDFAYGYRVWIFRVDCECESRVCVLVFVCMCVCVCVSELCATIFYHRLFTNETDFMCTKNKIDEQNIKRWCGIKKRWTMEVF